MMAPVNGVDVAVVVLVGVVVVALVVAVEVVAVVVGLVVVVAVLVAVLVVSEVVGEVEVGEVVTEEVGLVTSQLSKPPATNASVMALMTSAAYAQSGEATLSTVPRQPTVMAAPAGPANSVAAAESASATIEHSVPSGRASKSSIPPEATQLSAGASAGSHAVSTLPTTSACPVQLFVGVSGDISPEFAPKLWQLMAGLNGVEVAVVVVVGVLVVGVVELAVVVPVVVVAVVVGDDEVVAVVDSVEVPLVVVAVVEGLVVGDVTSHPWKPPATNASIIELMTPMLPPHSSLASLSTVPMHATDTTAPSAGPANSVAAVLSTAASLSQLAAESPPSKSSFPSSEAHWVVAAAAARVPPGSQLCSTRSSTAAWPLQLWTTLVGAASPCTRSKSTQTSPATKPVDVGVVVVVAVLVPMLVVGLVVAELVGVVLVVGLVV
jgi:hypothetical protein